MNEGLNFVAIDFETATCRRASACEVGLCEVEAGSLHAAQSWLIQPEGNIYDPANIAIHGITPKMTVKEPCFAAVWPQLAERMRGCIVVAHYAPFDMGVIRDECARCGLPLPEFRFIDSCYLARIVVPGLLSYSLEPLCHELGISVENHHRAGDDARMAAEVIIELCRRDGVETVEALVEKCRYRFGEFAGGEYRPFHRIGKATVDEFLGKYKPDGSKFDEENPFYGVEVVFTGKMFYERKELMKMVMDVGGRTKDSVTKTTDFLVVSGSDYRTITEGMTTGKLKKAIDMVAKGEPITIISEEDFFQMMGNDLPKPRPVRDKAFSDDSTEEEMNIRYRYFILADPTVDEDALFKQMVEKGRL